MKPNGRFEKYAGSGYLTQASTGWAQPPLFGFNPIMSPPSNSISGIFRSFLREIDRLPQSEFKSIKYRLLVEELCAFVEDVDLEKKLGIESKLLDLMEQLDLQEASSTRKPSDECSPETLEGFKKLAPWINPHLHFQYHKEEASSPVLVGGGHVKTPLLSQSGYSARQPTPRQVIDSYSNPDGPFIKESPDLPVNMDPYITKDSLNDLTKSLPHNLAPPPQKPSPKVPYTLDIPGKILQSYTQARVPQALDHPPPFFPTSNNPEKEVQPISQSLPYSIEFPQLKTFRDLFKPTVICYPQAGQISREESPFFMINSAACQLGLKSYWNGLSFSQAEEVWRLGVCVREWLIDIAKTIPEAEVYPDQSKDLVWPLYSCPKDFFVEILRRIYIQSAKSEPVWAHSEEEMDQFLSTCANFHTLQTTENSEGVYEPGFDSYNRIYCMYAMQPGSSSKNSQFRYFTRQIIVPFEDIDVYSGEKVTLTPTLWDPHKPYDALREHTQFTMNPPLLNWDEDTKNFTGMLKITKADCSFMTVCCIIQAHTIEDLPKGVSFETKVEASVTFRVWAPDELDSESEASKVDSVAEEPTDLWESESESGLTETSDLVQRFKILDDGIKARIHNLLRNSMRFEAEDYPGFIGISSDRTAVVAAAILDNERAKLNEKEGVISLSWDPQQWLNIIVCAEDWDESVWESAESGNGFNGGPDEGSNKEFGDRFQPVGRAIDSEKKLRDLLEDDMGQIEYEGYNLTVDLGIELALTRAGRTKGSHVFENIATAIENMPSIVERPSKGRKPGLFGTILPGEAHIKDKMFCSDRQENLMGSGIDTDKLRCIQWRKLILPRALKSLTMFDDEVEDMFTASMHVGKKSGFNFQDIKCIAKAIVLYGDLLDYTRVMRQEVPGWTFPPDFGSSRHNPYSANFSASELVSLIDEAMSVKEITEIMNPEMCDFEQYRFNFSRLESHGTIILTQKFPKSCTDLVTKWITGILSTVSAAIKTRDSDFVELAKAPGSWEYFELLLANDSEKIHQLRARRAEAQMCS